VVCYSGTFDAAADANSPGQGSVAVLDGNEDGSMQDGYRPPSPASCWRSLLGHSGGRSAITTTGATCRGTAPGAVDWIGQYLEAGAGFQFDWWGWIYRAGRNGVWVNASEGSSGDID
jgi:hypothetical protein